MSVKPKVDDRIRLSPRISRNIARLAKSKAAAYEIPLEYVIEQLLVAWIAGRISIVANGATEDNEKGQTAT